MTSLAGVNIPIDLDSLLDSLATTWEPPEEDIREIITSNVPFLKKPQTKIGLSFEIINAGKSTRKKET